MYSLGQDITFYLRFFSKSNLLRIFLYTPNEVWGSESWEPSDAQTITSFCDYVAQYGFYVELVLITDDDESRLPFISALIQQLNRVDIPNLILQGVNEPEVNMSTDKIKNILTQSKYLYTSGDQEDLTKWYGRYGTYQIPRDAESCRKEEALHECYDGGGPNNGNEKGYPVPWFDDETPRPDQMAGFIRHSDGTTDTSLVISDYYTIGALSVLSGAGCNFHFNGGKFNQLPNGFETQCYQAMLNGLNVFPTSIANNGSWQHLRDLENADSPNPLALRIYSRGNYAVVVRPNGFVAPINWTKLDALGICYKIQ